MGWVLASAWPTGYFSVSVALQEITQRYKSTDAVRVRRGVLGHSCCPGDAVVLRGEQRCSGGAGWWSEGGGGPWESPCGTDVLQDEAAGVV